MSLDELNMLFGTNHKTWTDIERKILKPIKEDLDANSKISFAYEANFDKMGINVEEDKNWNGIIGMKNDNEA